MGFRKNAATTCARRQPNCVSLPLVDTTVEGTHETSQNKIKQNKFEYIFDIQ